MVTIHDVAREAGVSPATVSRAFNNHKSVGAEYVLKVQEAAKRLGYRPNLVARNLRTSSSDVITLIVPDIDNSFHTAIARGAEDVAQEAGYSILLGNSDEDPQKEARYLEVSELHRVAGVLLCPRDPGVDISGLTSGGVPVVAIDRALNADVDTVRASNFDGAYQATVHLYEEGWRRPACVAGTVEIETHRHRVEGYLAAVHDLGLEPRVARVGHDATSGRKAALGLLATEEPPDSFFTVNENTCLGAMRALREKDKQVGSDIGMVTFDDMSWASLVTPRMTVVAQPAYQIGAQAARMLIERLQRDEEIPARKVELSTKLIVRESSKRLGSHSDNGSIS